MKIKNLSYVTRKSYLKKISELLNFGFLFSFFKISDLSDSEVLLSLNVSPTPYRPSKAFFWIKLQSQKTSNLTPKNLLLYSYYPPYLQFNVAEQQEIQSHAASVVHISTLNEGKRGRIALAKIVGSKNKASITRFQGCGF